MLYALGAAAAFRMGITINWAYYLVGQVAVTSIQLMAQYLNEFYDMEVDRLAANNRTWFSGGSGILSAGGIAPSAVMTAVRICAVVAALAGILACFHSPWMLPIITFSFLGSWFYSSPPLSLMASGWGELTTSLIVALFVPLAGYGMQGSFPAGKLWLVSVPLVLVHAAMLVSFEFPDRAADLSVGKKTLAVRLGLQGAARLVTALLGLAYLLVAVQTLLFSAYPGRWMAWGFPLAIWQMVMVNRVIHSPTRAHYYLLTLGAVGLFVLMVLLALFGFVAVV